MTVTPESPFSRKPIAQLKVSSHQNGPLDARPTCLSTRKAHTVWSLCSELRISSAATPSLSTGLDQLLPN
jgi:hypothetical protein